MKLIALLLLVNYFPLVGQTLSESHQSIINHKIDFLNNSWIPTKDQTDLALKETMVFLETYGYGEMNFTDSEADNYYNKDITEAIPEIIKLFNDNKYCVQFTGSHIKSNKYILLNFFIVQKDSIKGDNGYCNCLESGIVVKDKNAEWLHGASDGWYYFWTIRYDLTKGKCFFLNINNR